MISLLLLALAFIALIVIGSVLVTVFGAVMAFLPVILIIGLFIFADVMILKKILPSRKKEEK